MDGNHLLLSGIEKNLNYPTEVPNSDEANLWKGKGTWILQVAIGLNSYKKQFKKLALNLLKQSNAFSLHLKHHQLLLNISSLEKYFRFKDFVIPLP